MRLKAKVKTATGATKHFSGRFEAGEAVRDSEMATPSWVEIRESEGAFYLFYFAPDGKCLTDTWHQSLANAKRQANFEFAIVDADWTEVTD